MSEQKTKHLVKIEEELFHCLGETYSFFPHTKFRIIYLKKEDRYISVCVRCGCAYDL